jgi:hypothetical protein
VSSEVFRFVTVRPPQELAVLQPAADSGVDLTIAHTPFVDVLRSMQQAGDRDSMVSAAFEMVGSSAYLGLVVRIDTRVRAFMEAVATLPEAHFWTAVGQAFTQVFATDPAAYIQTEAFVSTYSRMTDSIVAAMIDTRVPAQQRALLVRLARALFLIRRLARNAALTLVEFQSAPLLLPPGIFPLPDFAIGADRPGASPGAEAEHRRARAALAVDLDAYRVAVHEVLTALERDGARPAPAGGAPSTGAPGSSTATRPRYGFALTDAAVEGLSDSTRAALRSVGITGGDIDVARAVDHIERESALLAQRLADHAPAPSARTPGPCPPAAEPPPDPTVTVPTGHGDARIMGIGDLMVVEQQLLRYQLGEIAHIENVLRSESRNRTFKTSHSVEQSLTTETETTETKEQDLSSTERFELNTESQTVINDTSSKNIGLTIHASYGPAVDATSTFNASSTSSRQQSTTASATFAREVTTRAAQRIQTRTLTRRTIRTVDVVEETNEHGFDNKNGRTDIVGVYRFVDKIYQAQVVNYGKRLMLEFVLPEPAAFLRYAAANHPLDAPPVPEPDRPGTCVDGTFVPLQPEDITRDNYLFWAGKYGAADITSPPSSVTVASATKRSPDSMATIPDGGERKISSDVFDVTIPDGYLCQTAFINIFGETQAGKHVVVYQVQDQQGTYVEPGDDISPFGLHLQPARTVSISVNSVGFHNYEVLATVLCTLALDAFRDWQFKTFTSVMTAYDELASRHAQAVAEARFAARDSGSGGIDPAMNRQTEQIELKKGCISLLTGQRFDLFDAVGRNIAPWGYPEIDFAEARAEGAYIQVFEQSFEWTNMVYVFYPYFWARKQEWPAIAQLGDADPLFARFLQAGAARVQVPVRLGFEAAVLNYLATGQLWDADGTFVNSDGTVPDPLHVSVLDELRSQLGDNTVPGPGRVSVTKNSNAVTGEGTAFAPDDVDRRIVIAGRTYVIGSVTDPHTIRLATPYQGDNAAGVGYSMGGRLVGEPWEVTLPTDLVKLDNTLVIL